MAINLLDTIQQNLGYPPLQKIDPNTQKVVMDDTTPGEHKFSQAAIPAVLTGLYKFVQTDDGAEDFLRGDNSSNWVSKIFDENKKEAVEKISLYARESNQDPVVKMNAIANEAVKLVKTELPENAGIKDVKLFFNGQQHYILPYLPAELNMGELLNDSTLDDKTNKMEGPVSSLIQTIGNAFSKPVSSEEIKTNESLK